MSSTPCYTGRRRDLINYEQSKMNFLKLAERRLGNHVRYRAVYHLHKQSTIDQIIEQKLEHPSLDAKYEVLQRGGKNILVLRNRKVKDLLLQVLSWEDMFDMFMPLHERTGHQGTVSLRKEIHILSRNQEIEYKFPKVGLCYFRRACNVCVQNIGGDSLLTASKTGVVHVIAMVQTRPGERFRYLLIYLDKATHYVILRPITSKTSMEISAELFKIFTEFGPPVELQVHGYNSSLTEQIADCLSELCPNFKIKMVHQPGEYELPAVVTDRLDSWMSKSKSLLWEVGCSIVQAEMNNDPLMRPGTVRYPPCCTPHNLYFHTTPKRARHTTSFAATNTDISMIDLTDHHLENKETPINEQTHITGDNQENNQNQKTKKKQVLSDQHLEIKETPINEKTRITGDSQESDQNQVTKQIQVLTDQYLEIEETPINEKTHITRDSQDNDLNLVTKLNQVTKPNLVTKQNEVTKQNQVTKETHTNGQNHKIRHDHETQQNVVTEPNEVTKENTVKQSKITIEHAIRIKQLLRMAQLNETTSECDTNEAPTQKLLPVTDINVDTEQATSEDDATDENETKVNPLESDDDIQDVDIESNVDMESDVDTESDADSTDSTDTESTDTESSSS